MLYCFYQSTGGASDINKGINTITRRDGKKEEMGQWDGMSATDISNIAAIYPGCPTKTGKPSPPPVTKQILHLNRLQSSLGLR